MRLVILLIGCSLLFSASAQGDPRVFTRYAEGSTPTNGDSGKVVMHEPQAIASLMKEYAGTKQPLKGYRVQIFLGERNKAEDIRRAFLLKHPQIPAYLSYLAPNFRVRVGDELQKMDGEQLRLELRDEFPGLYVVPDDIELPRLPEGK